MPRKEHKPLESTHSAFFSDWDPRLKKKAPARDKIQVKLVLKSQGAPEDLVVPRHLSLKERQELFSKHIGIEKDHLRKIKQFAREYRLKIQDLNQDLGIVTLSGTVGAIEKAFKVELHHHQVEHEKTREKVHVLGHEGMASVPAEIHDFVQGVIGLSNIPSTHQTPAKSPDTVAVSAATGVTSAWFANHYRFPKAYKGKGQRVAIISCGGGFDPKDFIVYFKKAGIRNPPKIRYQALNGVDNIVGKNAMADYELYTDCLVAACAAPEAKITVYGVDNSIFGFAEGVKYLSELGARAPHVISYSWGSSETSYSQADVIAVNRKLQYATLVSQITIFSAAGDFGSTNASANTEKTPLAVQYPTSSPWVTSCGGTMFQLTKKGKVKNEVAWNAVYLYDMLIRNASGGGFSKMNKRPDYQRRVLPSNDFPKWTKKQRGVPDIAGHACITPDNLCYWIYMQGKNWMTGGTSAVAPLLAALTVRLNEGLGTRIGFFNPYLYEMAESGAIRAINEGNTCMPKGPQCWEAADGWDPCTGLGVPDGEAMLQWLRKKLIPDS